MISTGTFSVNLELEAAGSKCSSIYLKINKIIFKKSDFRDHYSESEEDENEDEDENNKENEDNKEEEKKQSFRQEESK